MAVSRTVRSIKAFPRAGILVATVALLLCGFCAVAAVMLAQLRTDAWTSATRGAENLLEALSQDVSRNVELFDLSLQAVQEGLKLPDLPQRGSNLRQAILFDRAATANYLGTILVLDENADVVEDAGSVPPRRGNFADRDYFQALRTGTAQGLFISRPFRRRLTGEGDLVIALARRIDKPDGTFGGVVIGTLRLDYFKDLFGRLNLGPRDAVGLHRDDGILLNRFPYDEGAVGRDMSASPGFRARAAQRTGTWKGETALDGVRRVLVFTHVRDLPLILTVGLSERDIYASWTARATVIVAVLLILCGAAAMLFGLFFKELARRSRAERELRTSEAQYRLLADYATDVIMEVSPELVRRYVSPSCRATLGYEPFELVGRSAQGIIHPEDWPSVRQRARLAEATGGRFTASYRVRHHAGHWIWIEGNFNASPGDGGFIVVLRDIQARREAELKLEAAHAELTRLATTDGLTGLANRRQLDAMLGREWRRAARDAQPISLLLLDVDMFKAFNDRYGHQAGDGCLRRVAECVLAHARRPADLAARYGGEEMALLLPGTDEVQARRVAERVRGAVASLAVEHADNRDHGLVVTASIGVATVVPLPGADGTPDPPGIARLVDAADTALYRAKRGGRNRVRVSDAVEMLGASAD